MPHRHSAAFFYSTASISKARLLDFGFFVDHVLADDWIKFHDLHLVWHRALVLVCCVEVTSLGAGN